MASFRPSPRDTAYPSAKPPAWRVQHTSNRNHPACMTAPAACAMTVATVRATMKTATVGAYGATRATALGKNWFRAIPDSTGASTTCTSEEAVDYELPS